MGKFIDEHKHLYKASSNSSKKIDVTVTENRAVTDKSIELLNEFTKKAQDNIIRSVKIDNNNLKCIAIFYSDNFLIGIENRVHLHVRFMLNERCYFIKETFDKFKFYGDIIYNKKKSIYEREIFGNREALKLVYESLAKTIAQALIQDQPEVFKDLTDTLLFSFRQLKY